MQIPFTNLSRSQMSAGETESQRAFRKQIEQDYAEQALECAAEFEKELKTVLAKAAPGYAGSAVVALLERTPRYVYIKNTNTSGERAECDVEIDLLAHQFGECAHRD